MKVTDVNIDQLLYTQPVRTTDYDEAEESGGLFKKLFQKKDKHKPSYFETRIEEFGLDDLYDDIKDGYDAYQIKGAPFETMVLLSNSYLILPEKEIFPLYKLSRFALMNEVEWKRPYEQYAIDRINEPYDPSYVSEFENEESFELDRFNILLHLYDNNNVLFEYVIKMEIADRKDFRAKLNERMEQVGVIDTSEEEVMEGRFPDQQGNW